MTIQSGTSQPKNSACLSLLSRELILGRGIADTLTTVGFLLERFFNEPSRSRLRTMLARAMSRSSRNSSITERNLVGDVLSTRRTIAVRARLPECQAQPRSAFVGQSLLHQQTVNWFIEEGECRQVVPNHAVETPQVEARGVVAEVEHTDADDLFPDAGLHRVGQDESARRASTGGGCRRRRCARYWCVWPETTSRSVGASAPCSSRCAAASCT